MKKLLTLAFVIVSGLSLYAQKPTIAWVKGIGGSRGEDGKTIAIDNAGNVITGGQCSSSTDFDPGPAVYSIPATSSIDGYIVKLDSAGTFVWAKRIGNKNPSLVTSLTTDAAGNVYAIGSFMDTIDADPGPGIFNLISKGKFDGYLIKLSASGNFVWAKQVGGPGRDNFQSLALDAAGNLYCTGAFDSTVDFNFGAGTFNLTSAGGSDVFVTKLDGAGNFVWAKAMGSTEDDFSKRIALDSARNIYLTGQYKGTADFDPGPATANLTAIAGEDVFAVKLDNSGNYIWAKSIGNTADNLVEGLAVTRAGSVYLTGEFTGTIDFDPGTANFPLTSNSGRDGFILKLSTAGNFQWAKSMGGKSMAPVFSAATDASDNVYLAGAFQDTVDFDPGPQIYNMIGPGIDIFISKLDAFGNFVWAYRAGGTQNEGAYEMAIGSKGNVYATGMFFSTPADFDPAPDTAVNLNSIGSSDAFVLKLSPFKSSGGVSVPSSTIPTGEDAMQLYPNPLTSRVTLKSNHEIRNARIELFSISGQLIKEWTWISGSTFVMDLSGEPAGMYFTEVHGSDKIYRIRLMKY